MSNLLKATGAMLLAGIAVGAFAMSQGEKKSTTGGMLLSRVQTEELMGAYGPQPTTKPDYGPDPMVKLEYVQASFPSTNIEKGCVILQTAMASRIEQLNDMDAAACRRMKAVMDKSTSDNEGKWFSCLNATGVMYNRNHGRFDLDRLPSEVSEGTMRGCSMMIYDISEAQYEHVKKRM
jgi:hypothetical protein